MAIGVTFIILGVLVVAIWLVIEAKRLKHKVFAIFLIVLILFTYISFVSILKNNDVDLKTASGLKTAAGLYFSWLGGMFHNVKSITTYAFKQDWKNTTFEKKQKAETEDSIWSRI